MVDGLLALGHVHVLHGETKCHSNEQDHRRRALGLQHGAGIEHDEPEDGLGINIAHDDKKFTAAKTRGDDSRAQRHRPGLHNEEMRHSLHTFTPLRPGAPTTAPRNNAVLSSTTIAIGSKSRRPDEGVVAS